MERISIVGVGQTPFAADRRESTFADLVHDAVTEALEDAGLEVGDIDNIVTTSNDFFDGRTISSMAVGDAAGAGYGGGKNVSTVEGDGTFGAFYGLTRILSGAYRSTLVVAHSKGSEGEPRLLTNAYFDPIYERLLGLDDAAAAGLQARAWLDRTGQTRERLAEVVVKNRAAGARNPNAHLREPVTLKQVLGAEPLAAPLGRLDAAPRSDGAAAIVLAREDFKKGPVRVEGAAFSADAHHLGDRDLAWSPALRRAAKQAYRMAGVSDPAKEIGAAELLEQFSYQEPLWREELGLGELPVNLSGGCLSAHAAVAAGLVRIVEAALQLRGEASNQADGPTRVVAHGQHGLCGQSHCVWVLGRG